MSDEAESENKGLTEKVSGLVQKTIGGIEEIGAILTADPITAAEGEYNVEVGSIREEIGEDMEEHSEREENSEEN